MLRQDSFAFFVRYTDGSRACYIDIYPGKSGGDVLVYQENLYVAVVNDNGQKVLGAHSVSLFPFARRNASACSF